MAFSRSLVLFLTVSTQAAFGQEPAKTLPSLPAAPQQWLNSPPLTTEILKDKAVVFWYFEETCPTCEAKWPELLETAKKHEGEPVLFVAVCSGTSRPTVEQYLRRNKIDWPVLVDTDRSFEKASDVREISLQNIHQIKVLSGDGTFAEHGNFEIGEAADKVAPTGKWKIDPKEIPVALRPTWQQIEFGNFAPAAAVLKRNLASPKEDIKAGAEKLQGAVDAELQAAMTQASEAKSSGDTWKAYKTLMELPTRFKGYTLPATVGTDLKELKGSEGVKKELNADKALHVLKQKVSGGKFSPKSVQGQMEKFLEQYPDTEAAAEVQEALSRLQTAAPGTGPTPPTNQ